MEDALGCAGIGEKYEGIYTVMAGHCKSELQILASTNSLCKLQVHTFTQMGSKVPCTCDFYYHKTTYEMAKNWQNDAVIPHQNTLRQQNSQRPFWLW